MNIDEARARFIELAPTRTDEEIVDGLISAARRLGGATNMVDRLDYADEMAIVKAELMRRLGK